MQRPSLPLLVACSLALLGRSEPLAAQTYLKASNTGVGDHVAWSVAAWGDTLAIGAIDEDSNAVGVNGSEANNSATDSGAVYVFVRTGAGWMQEAYLKPGNTSATDKFGWALSLYGDTLVVGAQGEDSNATGVNGNAFDDSALSAGAAYVFRRSAGVWAQEAYLKASNTETTDMFGHSVSISGDTIVIGAFNEDGATGGVNGNEGNGQSQSGAAYVFVRNGGTWSQQAYLKASIPQTSDAFGIAVAVFGDTVVVGANDEDGGSKGVNGDESSNSAPSSGAAYVFVRNGTTWSQQAYLKASNALAADAFGSSVAISGETVVVGATLEDNSATGVNGNQNLGFAVSSGAAYVFVRSGSTWSQQAYLKASNTNALDQFATSLAISGDRIAVGAPSEGSAATGVNGDQASNAAVNAGAAYSFVRSGGTWSQQAYLKASNTGTQDVFGSACAVTGDTVVAGAYKEDGSATGVGGDGSSNASMDAGAAYVFELPAASPWSNQGSGLAGVSGVPAFVGSGSLASGSANALDLSGAAPSKPAGLFVALASTPTPFKGGTLLPVPVLTLVSLPTSVAGTISLPFLMPAGVPAGTSLWLQWAIQDPAAVQGVALSNALRGVTP